MAAHVEIGDLAVRCGGMRWMFGRLFEITGAWSTNTTDPEVRLHLAVHSRHMGEHAEAWEALAPTSPALLDRAVPRPPAPGWDDASRQLAATTGTVERLAGLHRVLIPRAVAAVDDLREMLDPVAAGAALRVAGLARDDLIAAWSEGIALLVQRLDGSTIGAAMDVELLVERAFVDA